jgi:hypothetical protein
MNRYTLRKAFQETRLCHSRPVNTVHAGGPADLLEAHEKGERVKSAEPTSPSLTDPAYLIMVKIKGQRSGDERRNALRGGLAQVLDAGEELNDHEKGVRL